MEYREKIIKWLLEDDNPPVKYLVLTRLLNKPESDPDVLECKSRLMEYSVTGEILAHWDEFWNNNDKAYWKYTGKYWQVIFLGQFLADGRDLRIADGIKRLLENRSWVTIQGGQCLTANLLAAFCRLGYGSHPVVMEEAEALAVRITKDQGIKCTAMGYSLLARCYMALPKLLLLFGEIPTETRSASVNKAIDLIVRQLKDNEVFFYSPGTRKLWMDVLAGIPKRKDLPEGETVKGLIAKRRIGFLEAYGLGERSAKRGWLKFGFPLHYNSDILEAMYSLSRLRIPLTAELEKAVQVIRDKESFDGRWIMDNSLNGKMHCDVEEKGKPSKWITYFALYVLNHFTMNDIA